MQGKKVSSMCPVLGETKITKRVGTQPPYLSIVWHLKQRKKLPTSVIKKLKWELTKSSSLHARMSFLRIFYCHQTIPFRIFVKIFFHKEVSLCVTIFQSSNHRLPPLTYKRIVTKSRFSITLVSLLKLFCAITRRVSIFITS